GSVAFAAHTNADHAHQISASTNSPSPAPSHVRWCEMSDVTCVTAKTKTRSQSSSTGDVRRSSLMLENLGLVSAKGALLAVVCVRAADPAAASATRFAFECGQDVCSANLDGSGRRQLTRGRQVN